MTKLTDSQLILLSRAVQRDDGILEDAGSMRAGAATKVAGALIRKKLMREVRSKPGMPVWRQDDQERNVSLVITKAGRAAIGVEDDVGQQSVPESVGDNKAVIGREYKTQNSPRSGSKQARVVTLLSSRRGVSIDAISEEMGWLSHTTRAVLSGLRKRGYGISRVNDGKRKSLYHIDDKTQATARD